MLKLPPFSDHNSLPDGVCNPVRNVSMIARSKESALDIQIKRFRRGYKPRLAESVERL